MRKLVSLMIVASAALGGAAPAYSAPPAPRHAPDRLATMLTLRLRSIELQIDLLSDRDLIGREEARDLRGQARRLEQRLRGASAREANDVELAVTHLQQQLRFAGDAGQLGGDVSQRRDLGLFDDGERYDMDRDSDIYRGTFQREDPRGDPFAKWKERDERGPH